MAADPAAPTTCQVAGCIAELTQKEIRGTVTLCCKRAAHHRAWLIRDGQGELAWVFSMRGKGSIQGAILDSVPEQPAAPPQTAARDHRKIVEEINSFGFKRP